MAFEFHLPDLAEGMTEAEVVGWKVKEGDAVALDQPLVEVMSDKATVEIPSPRAGRLARINFREGQVCKVGEVLFVIDEGAGAAATAPSAGASASAPTSAAPPAVARPAGGNGHGNRDVPAAASPSGRAAGQAARGAGGPARSAQPEVIEARPGHRSRVLATPATRRLARQLGVELGDVTATGRRGRVTSDDVRRSAETGGARNDHGPGHGMQARGFAPIAIAPGGEEERIPLRGLRKRIAENMARSVATAAHFTYVEEVDTTELVAVRRRAADRAAERGIKLTYLPFIVKAVVAGLKRWPQLNASLDETTQEIVRKKYYHVGIAAQGPHGLMVTVVRDADRRSIFDLALEIERLGEAVRNGTATRDELTGSTFTISSLGKLGGVLATPIINFPEVAILGVHKIEERPAVRHGQIVIRHLMNLSISVDHRLADGWDGAMFVQDVKSLLEDPTTMFMEMI
ncbi:MAG TPA: dihydrolipoamide acetyltransferase family protein [Kofleriaceae bacterium]|nr:dihydrolipoamide acetyltransferase family protein [Kofleriaceae bacterium]